MFKKIFSVLIIVAVLAGSLCACGDDSVTMVMAIGSDPLCLDPQIVETDCGKLIVANCFEGLVRLDKDFKIVPGVAKSWDISEDGLTYTFHLRKNSKWQLLKSYKNVLPDEKYMENFDNRVTAQDFEFGLRRTVDPITQSDSAEKYFCIKNAAKINNGEETVGKLGVKAVDDTTLVITLERENDDFLRLLTLPAAMPCKEAFFRETHAKYGLAVEYTFCNGPFYLSRWVEDNSIVMRKSESYKGESGVSVDAVYFNINKDRESVITKFKQQSYCCAYVSDSERVELSEVKGIQYVTCNNTVSGLFFNCNDPIISNINIRKALMSITDTDAMAKPRNATGAAGGIIPESCRFGEASYREAAGKLKKLPYDEAVSKELWTKGMKELDLNSVSVKIICTEEYAPQMQNAIQRWQKIYSTEIIAKVETLSDSDFRTAVRNGKYQLAVGRISDSTASPTDTLKLFTSESKSNVYGYSSEDYDKLVEKAIKTSGGKNIVSDCKAAEQLLIDDAVFCPLYTYSEYIAFGKDFTGLFMSPDFKGINFANGGLK